MAELNYFLADDGGSFLTDGFVAELCLERFAGVIGVSKGTGKPRETEITHAWFGGEALEKQIMLLAGALPDCMFRSEGDG